MKLLSWSIRGLNMPLKQKEIRRMVYSHRISILCLVETRVISLRWLVLCSLARKSSITILTLFGKNLDLLGSGWRKA
jgi:hypothetical protein